MLISLFRNQQRVISLCNNDLSVTRSWPFITHHLRCFLSPGEKEQNCPMMFSVSCAGLHGAREQVPAPRLGHPASKAFQSQPHLSAHQKGFPSGQNLTFLVGKKKSDKKNQTLILNLFWHFKGEIKFFFSYEVIFLSVVRFPMARGYKGQNQNAACFYWHKTSCSCAKHFSQLFHFTGNF